MYRSVESGEAGFDPLAPLAQLCQWLLTSTLQVALGLMLGRLAARAMRARGLHWSWAVAALPVIPIVHELEVGAAMTLAISVLVCALLGRRWQGQDLDAGRDLAGLARERVSITRLALKRLRLTSLRRALRSARACPSGHLALGCDRDNRLVSIPFGGSAGGTHALVLGATGSGKTHTQAWIATAAIERGMGAVVIDPKGDDALRAAVHEAGGRRDRQLIEWSPTGPWVYNPYARGSDGEVSDKVLAGERFTEPHYLRQAQRYLGHVVRALRSAGEEVSLSTLVAHLEPDALERLARTLPEHLAQPVHAYLDSLTSRQRQDLAGVRDRTAILAESDIGSWLDPQLGAGRVFDLLDAVKEGAVVYFRLAADSRPLLTQMLGAAIVQDLQSVVASLQGQPVSTLALIDEFAAVSAEQVVRLFGRARSAGLSLVLGTQEIADLRLSARERVLERVIGNLTVLIAHRQVMPDSCALVAGLGGMRGTWRTAQHSDGRSTRTRASEAVLDPDALMGLPPGHAAVSVLTSAEPARVTRVFALDER